MFECSAAWVVWSPTPSTAKDTLHTGLQKASPTLEIPDKRLHHQWTAIPDQTKYFLSLFTMYHHLWLHRARLGSMSGNLSCEEQTLPRVNEHCLSSTTKLQNSRPRYSWWYFISVYPRLYLFLNPYVSQCITLTSPKSIVYPEIGALPSIVKDAACWDKLAIITKHKDDIFLFIDTNILYKQ